MTENNRRKSITDIRAAFGVFDTNNDGCIDKSELKNLLEKLNLGKLSNSELDRIFTAVSSANSDKIAWKDFLSYMLPIVEYKETDEEIRAVFAKFDKNSDGFIDKRELRTSLSELTGEIIPEIEINEMMESVDKNCDGRIDIHEFKELMNNE